MDKNKLDKGVQNAIADLRQLNLSYENLLHVAAVLMISGREQNEIIESLLEDQRGAELAMSLFSKKVKDCSAGAEIAMLEMLAESKNDVAKGLLAGISLQKKAAGKRAVRFRSDQVLKPLWVKHVRACIERGVTINNVGDLLNEPGYAPQIASIAKLTLKAWAKEAVPSLKFKPGRPK